MTFKVKQGPGQLSCCNNPLIIVDGALKQTRRIAYSPRVALFYIAPASNRRSARKI